MNSVLGAFGNFDKSITTAMLMQLVRTGDSVETIENSKILLIGRSSSKTSNLTKDAQGRWAAVAGDVFISRGELRIGAVPLLDEWRYKGPEISSSTDGAFVSVLYDSNAKQAFFYNDIVGQVPLYYYSYHKALYFSSELRAFLQLPEELMPSIDPVGLDLFMAYGCIPGTTTILKGVKTIPPALYAKVEPTGFQPTQYWKPQKIAIDKKRSLDSWLDAIYHTFETAVKEYYEVSEKPVGLLLGGLDSSNLALMLGRVAKQEEAIAYTADFQNKQFNERFPEEVAKCAGIKLERIPISYEDMPSIITELAAAYDEPVADMVTSPVSLAIAKEAKKTVSTIFDGTGADTEFASFIESKHTTEILPAAASYAIPEVVREKLRISKPRGRRQQLLSQYTTTIVEGIVGSEQIISHERLAALYGSKRAPTPKLSSIIVKEIDAKKRRGDPFHVSLKTATMMHFLPSHGFNLARNRAVAYASGVKLSSPYLRRAMLELALSIPWWYKVPSGEHPKPLARYFAVKRNGMPQEIAYQRKMGLGSSRQSMNQTQMALWVQKELRNWARDTILEHYPEVQQYFSKEGVLNYLERNKPKEIFHLLTFILWHHRYFVQNQ